MISCDRNPNNYGGIILIARIYMVWLIIDKLFSEIQFTVPMIYLVLIMIPEAQFIQRDFGL